MWEKRRRETRRQEERQRDGDERGKVGTQTYTEAEINTQRPKTQNKEKRKEEKPILKKSNYFFYFSQCNATLT